MMIFTCRSSEFTSMRREGASASFRLRSWKKAGNGGDSDATFTQHKRTANGKRQKPSHGVGNHG